MKTKGFTLIELLVVVSILGLLAALLFPVFITARRDARMTACASNLHQISLALHLYAADADGVYPFDDDNTYDCLRQDHKHLAWTLLTPYTHNTHIFHCPDEHGPIDAQAGYVYADGPQKITQERHTLRKAPRPGLETVVAFCPYHASRTGDYSWPMDSKGNLIGTLIIVREDGATARIQASLIEHWIYHAGQWHQDEQFPVPETNTGDYTTLRFPGDAWPPDFQR